LTKGKYPPRGKISAEGICGVIFLGPLWADTLSLADTLLLIDTFLALVDTFSPLDTHPVKRYLLLTDTGPLFPDRYIPWGYPASQWIPSLLIATLLTDTFSSRLERVLIRREVFAEAKDISEGRVSSRRRVSVKGEQYELREDIH